MLNLVVRKETARLYKVKVIHVSAREYHPQGVNYRHNIHLRTVHILRYMKEPIQEQRSHAHIPRVPGYIKTTVTYL
jgi:hypothetical protein